MSELLGQQIGNIRIVDVIGRGGMGEVYAGYDVKLDRKVAVKAIRGQARLDDEARARLLREARALSALDHPNICRIYDYLEHGDDELLVLELIDGTSLRRVIKDGVKPADALRIAEHIARVLAAAHAENIVHRDLKPDNVMLTTTGGVKVLDFGIARTLDEATSAALRRAQQVELRATGDYDSAATMDSGTRLVPLATREPSQPKTRLGSIVGTIAYMSPEQARGEHVGPASDMYSFGMLLQELLTGRPALSSEHPAHVALAKAAWGESEPAVGLDRELAGLVERLKALAPGARPTAAEAAAQLAHIRGRGRRWLRLAGIGLAALLAGLTVTKYTLDLRRERNRAVAAQAAESQARAEAEQVVQFLTDLFDISDPSEARGRSVTARELLERGADRIAAELVDQPVPRARLMTTIGVVYRKLGLYAEAETLLEEALAIREQHLPPGHPEVIGSLDSLASLYLAQGAHDEAAALYRRALTLAETLHGPDHAKVAGRLNNLGLVLRRMGRHAEAESVLRRALAIKEAALGLDHPEVAGSLHNLASLYLEQGRYDEAEPLYKRCLTIQRTALPSDHPDHALALSHLADIYAKQGRVAEAERLFRRALALKEKIYGPRHPEVGRTANNLASLYLEQGSYDRAQPLLTQALEIFEAVHGADHLDVAVTLYNLGEVHRHLRQSSAAEASYLRSAAIFERIQGPSSPYVAYPVLGLANLYRDSGRAGEAVRQYQHALEIRRQALPPGHPDIQEVLDERAKM